MNTKQKQFAVIAFVAIVVGTIMAQQMMDSNIVISANDAHTQLQNDTSIVLLDVRTTDEHIGERIGNTPHIPVQELERRIHELDAFKDRTIIVYCRSGNRSGSAAKLLREKGFHAVNMLGGIQQWKTEKFPIVSGPIQ